MTEYIKLLSELNKHKDKIKDLPDLIWKLSFNSNRIGLLRHVVDFLNRNLDTQDFRWLDNSEQKKSADEPNRIILAQFAYRVKNPARVLTVYRKKHE